MAAGAGFWNLMAKNYAKSAIADEQSYQTKLDKTRSYFRPDMDVLELGCGTGSTAIIHAPYVKSYEGVDFSNKMLGFAQQKLEDSKLQNMLFTCQPVKEVKRAPNSIDMVLAMSILHLLPDYREVTANVYSMLKPGGMFISSTACVRDMGGVFKYFVQAGSKIGIMPPVQNFTRDELEQVITEAGFVFEDVWQPRRDAAVFIAARKPA
ncbi:class I SAM-dependent methyltransferase [Falsihalocynthiibacter sp. SS001]|uniref:class I SAM-dependent methyltransferase n=1 Tax=Falsihalocynthiibacter sp. SS001 TaxID=3349698 RepID=UPI0036D40C2A